jgi:hypothetical protein
LRNSDAGAAEIVSRPDDILLLDTAAAAGSARWYCRRERAPRLLAPAATSFCTSIALTTQVRCVERTFGLFVCSHVTAVTLPAFARAWVGVCRMDTRGSESTPEMTILQGDERPPAPKLTGENPATEATAHVVGGILPMRACGRLQGTGGPPAAAQQDRARWTVEDQRRSARAASGYRVPRNGM